MAFAFIRNGWSELKRKMERRRWKGQLRKQHEEMTQAQRNLGEQAWKQQMDLSAFADLRQQLTQMDRDAGALDSASKNLQAEEQRLTEQRGAENAKFEAQRKAIEDKKRPADDSLSAARAKQTGMEQTVQRLEARRAAIGAELAALDKPGAAPDAQQAGKRAPLLAEQEALPGQISAAQAGLPAAAAETQRLTQESQGYTADLKRIEQERAAAIAPLDEQLKAAAARMQSVRKETGNIDKNRAERFTQLGAALFAAKSAEPAIGEPMGAALAIAQRQTATQEALDASLALSKSMPSMTMLKFASALILTPLLIAGIAGGSYWALTREKVYPDLGEPVREVNPYLSHALRSNPSYILANQLYKARSEEEVQQRLLDVFRAIHLGVYRADGQRILAGSERNDKDFFLYDFQWKILAHAFFTRNIASFSSQSLVFGKGLLEMPAPEKLEPVLAEVIQRRYREAAAKPDDPMSFLILLVDGLARHQILPYTLDEIKTKPHDKLYLDPIQTWLLALDYAIGPRNGPGKSAANHSFSLPWLSLPAVHAAGCEDIVGDGTKEGWGRAVDIGVDVGEETAKQVGAEALEHVAGTVGKVTGVVQAAGDLLILYGITIKVTPSPHHIHMINKEMPNFLAGIEAKVTFDSQGVSDEVLKCGWLAGKKMPVNGAVQGVELWWDFEPYLAPDFEAATDVMLEGSKPMITNTAGGFRTRTDEGGVSTFFIRPIRACGPHPKGKLIEGNRYLAIVSARIVTADMPSPGLGGALSMILKFGPGAIEYMMQGRKGYSYFWSEWHRKKRNRYNEEEE